MSSPAKHRVRQSFERAAASYDTAAKVQRRICGRLALGLPGMMTPGIILDAGCGTGYALRLLRERFPPANLIGLDLAPAMLQHGSPGAHRIAGDVHHLPIGEAAIGLYWSSLVLQWCQLPAALAEAHRVIWKGGRLAVATLGPGTFAELRQAFASGDAYRHTLDFLPPEAVAEAAAQAGFQEIRVTRESQAAHYPDLKSALRAIKAVGANQLGEGRRRGLMGRQQWQQVTAAYEAFRQPSGLPLTYDVILLHATK